MSLPTVLLTNPNPKTIETLQDKVNCVDWDSVESCSDKIEGVFIQGHATIDAKVMDRFPNLKILSNCGVGVDHINLADARERNILVGNTPGVLSEATADMAFALLLAAARRVVEGDNFARGSDFLHFDPDIMTGTEVHHATLGIIGMGRIGIEIARRGIGFNMKVIYHNRSPRKIDDPGISADYVSKEELFEKADFIVIVVPLSEETRNLITYENFVKMKSSAVFVNIARGGVVDTDGITQALQEKQIYAAGLDVTEPEPLPRDHPLLKQQNLTIAPHTGSATHQTRKAMFDLAISNLLNGMEGKEIVSSVM